MVDLRMPAGNKSSVLEEINRAFEVQLRSLMRHRERYVKAWIAATGLHPTECVLVERRMGDGSVRITIEPKHD